MVYVLFGVGCSISFYLGARAGFNIAIEEMNRIATAMEGYKKNETRHTDL